MVEAYSKCLLRGHKYAMHALPRVIAIWIQAGRAVHSYSQQEKPSDEREKAKKNFELIHASVLSLISNMPPTYWALVANQLAAAVGHPHTKVSNTIVSILVHFVLVYPAQAGWMLRYIFESTDKRRKGASETLKTELEKNNGHPSYGVFFKAYKFTNYLNAIAAIAPSLKQKRKLVPKFSISAYVDLPKRSVSADHRPVVLPIQYMLTPAVRGASGDMFPPVDSSTVVMRIDDTADVMRSAMVPTKINVVDGNGRKHPLLLKHKDDIRKDARVLDLAATLNRLLAESPMSAPKNIYFRTYLALPLTDDGGLIEWVPCLTHFRDAVESMLKATGHRVDHKTVNEMYSRSFDLRKPESCLKLYKKITGMYPPMAHHFFVHRFPQPNEWYRARQRFARTAAAWSMIGAVVGLGDRHGENVLIDYANGDCVHVDFSYMFDLGKKLKVPERVPFRLTRNMLDAFGVLGYEGTFRKCCEATMKVLRANRDQLMNELESFLNDPVLQWDKVGGSTAQDIEGVATESLSVIERRFDGYTEDGQTPLSVEGQVDYLIKVANSPDNLARMYSGWMAYY
mmetsp:Transcript_29274/g.75414  ORF Transcript_29274/g.75414 Transcript_29274/m.75414 type:complete len:568 (-) Transcript_29274:798-2501(-)